MMNKPIFEERYKELMLFAEHFIEAGKEALKEPDEVVGACFVKAGLIKGLKQIIDSWNLEDEALKAKGGE